MRAKSPLGATRAGAALAAVGAVLLGPGTASAQDVYAQVEGGVNVMVSKPQSTQYGLGFYGSGRVGLWFTGAFGMHLQGGYANWGAATGATNAAGQALSPGTLSSFGAGIRIAPEISRDLGRIFLDVGAAYGATGATGISRLTVDAGIGWLIPLADAISIAPVVRYNQVISVDGDQGDARYITAGVAFGFPGRQAIVPPPPPPPPPPSDTDHDGVIDPSDLCPQLPAGMHPDPQRRGCPLGDRDHDGVLDDIDQCPDEPAGDPHRPGCPAIVAPPPAPTPCLAGPVPVVTPVVTPTVAAVVAPAPLPAGPPAALIENGHIRINDAIYFDTGAATIQSRSFPILDAVVAVLSAHPEITGLRIEGHTDNVGNARRNLTLSRNRARSVVTYIATHGIDMGRMSAAGYGATRPVVEGDSEDARARNRRVEFLITGGPGAATGVEPEPTGGHHGGGHHGGGHHGGGHHGHH